MIYKLESKKWLDRGSEQCVCDPTELCSFNTSLSKNTI